MASYKEYETNKGTFWHVRGYLGINPLTGEKEEANKRGFKTKKEAQNYFEDQLSEFGNSIENTSYISHTEKKNFEKFINDLQSVAFSTDTELFEVMEMYKLFKGCDDDV